MMELVTTYICKKSDIGVHNNMFGGVILGLIDQSSGAYASQICDTGKQTVVVSTNIKFVRIDEEGNPIPISERVKKRYYINNPE